MGIFGKLFGGSSKEKSGSEAAQLRKMLDSSKVFYPGHDRPFKLDGEEISYIQGPTEVEISDSNEGGSAIALSYRVHPHRHVNIVMVQKD